MSVSMYMCVYIYMYIHTDYTRMHTHTTATWSHRSTWMTCELELSRWCCTGLGRGLTHQLKRFARVRRIRSSNSCFTSWWVRDQPGIHVMSPMYVPVYIAPWNSCDPPNVGACVYSCVYMYMCVYEYISIHTYAHSHAHTHTHMALICSCEWFVS